VEEWAGTTSPHARVGVCVCGKGEGSELPQGTCSPTLDDSTTLPSPLFNQPPSQSPLPSKLFIQSKGEDTPCISTATYRRFGR
jgi:hypothetical protein